MAAYLTEKYKELEKALGPAEAKKAMEKLLTEAGQKELLSSTRQKQDVTNNLTLFEGLKNKASTIEQREKAKVEYLRDIRDKLNPKAK